MHVYKITLVSFYSLTLHGYTTIFGRHLKPSSPFFEVGRSVRDHRRSSSPGEVPSVDFRIPFEPLSNRFCQFLPISEKGK